MSRKSSNHAKAPICAEFVEELRELFGEVRVLYVKEGDFELGEPSDTGTKNRAPADA
jgi:hypothetical protein